jgi:hypothetical protein
MIEAAPEDRFVSADELLAALTRPGGAGVAKREVPGVLRHRRAVAIASAVAMLLGLLAMLLLGRAVGPMPLAPAAAAVAPSPPPISPVSGALTIDLDRDFGYEPTGFPMGRSVGQTSLPPFTRTPPAGLTLPDPWRGEGVEAYYGYFPLGNGDDTRIDFVLGRSGGGPWTLQVDANNDEDLTDDGPPMGNEGTGEVMAREVSVEVGVVTSQGARLVRPYHLWVVFSDAPGGGIRGSFYARNHYRGSIAVARTTFPATAFETRDHDGLYRDAGVCIDLNADGECAEDSELFHDGDVVPFPGEPVRLTLAYP